MEDIVTLFALSLAMLAGCYIAGIIPLTVTLSEEKLRMVTVLGAGLLVGTALAVIIPEGVHAMYSNGQGHSHHHEHSLDLPKIQAKEVHHIKSEDAHIHHKDTGVDHLKTSANNMGVAVEAGAHADHAHHDMVEEHSKIGISLVFGFIFMLLVDQIGGSFHSHSMPSDLEMSATTAAHNRNKITATLGLVVHAAADGIALGAAVTLSESHITMIIFLAIMLHKAPAAFGLVSFLLHEGLDRTRIRKHLAIFSAAAPFMAIVTYLGLGQQSKETLSDLHTTGIAMLFSAGTFLYVATVHVLPEISTSHTQHTAPDGTVIIRESKGFKKLELVALVSGALLPVILAIGHKH